VQQEFLLAFFLMGMLGSQFFPESDKSEFNIVINTSPGSSLEQTSLICEKVEAVLRKSRK
jgi:multidrug efflux pump subunit AcrB